MENKANIAELVDNILRETELFDNPTKEFTEQIIPWLEKWIIQEDNLLNKKDNLEPPELKLQLIEKLNILFNNSQFIKEFNSFINKHQANTMSSILNSKVVAMGNLQLGHTIVIQTGNKNKPQNIEKMANRIENLKKLVASARVNQAIGELEKIINKDCQDLGNVFTNHSRAWEDLGRSEMIGSLSVREISVARAGLTDQLLQIIDRVQECLNKNTL